MDEIKNYIHPNMLIVLESTTYPGSTKELILPYIADSKDLIAGKATFVSVMGLDEAKHEVKVLISKACDALDEYGSKAEGLRELAKYVGSRKK